MFKAVDPEAYLHETSLMMFCPHSGKLQRYVLMNSETIYEQWRKDAEDVGDHEVTSRERAMKFWECTCGCGHWRRTPSYVPNPYFENKGYGLMEFYQSEL